jgi:hypothetical protein
MDIHRCDECGVEAPDSVRFFRPTEERWWFVGPEHRLGFHFCRWECVVNFVAKHPTTPTPLVETLEKQHRWNAEKQRYEKLPSKSSPKRVPKRQNR